MRCTTAQRRILKQLDDRLPLPHFPGLDAHIESCPSCGAFLQQHQQLEEWLVRTPTPDVDDRFEEAFLSRLDQRIDEQIESTSHPFRVVRWLVPIAFAGLAAAGLLTLFLATSRTTSIITGLEVHSGIALDSSTDAARGTDNILRHSPNFKPVDLTSDSNEPNREHRNETALDELALSTQGKSATHDRDHTQIRDTSLHTEVRMEIMNALACWTESESAVLSRLDPLKGKGWPVEELLGEIALADDKESSSNAISTLGLMGTFSAHRQLREVYADLDRRAQVLQVGMDTSPSLFVDEFADSLTVHGFFDQGLRGLIQARDGESLKKLASVLIRDFTNRSQPERDWEALTIHERCLGIRSLSYWGPDATPTYLRLIQAGAPLDFILTCLEDVRNMERLTFENYVLIALQDSFEGVPSETAMSIVGPMKIDSAAETLRLQLNEPKSSRSYATAVRTLGELGTRAALEALLDHASEVANTRLEVPTLTAIVRGLDSSRVDEAELFEMIESYKGVFKSSWIVQLFSQSSSPVVLSTLVDLFSDARHGDVARMLAADSIAHFGDERHVGFLVSWSVTHPRENPRLRGAALAASAHADWKRTEFHLKSLFAGEIPTDLLRWLKKASVNNQPTTPTLWALGESIPTPISDDRVAPPSGRPRVISSPFPRRSVPGCPPELPLRFQFLER